MATKVVVGNLLEDATVTMTPAADPLFPAEFLSDGPGQLGPRFSALDADPEIAADFGGNNQIPYIDGSPATAGQVIATCDPFETLDPEFADTPWSVVTVPTPGSAAHVQVVDDGSAEGPDHSGNGLSLFLTGGDPAGGSRAWVRFRLRAATPYKMGAWTQKGASDVGECSVRLYSPTFGTYLTPAGTWSASPTDLVAAGTYDAGATWFGINAGAGVQFETEGEAGEEILLELQFHLDLGGGGTQGRFDDIVIVPAVDFLGVFNGHNIRPALAPVWESSDDGSSWTNRATFTVGRHQFFALLDAPIFARFHRLKMTGTPAEKVYLSDLVLGLAEALEREPVTSTPIVKSYRELGQQRLETPAGSRRIANRGPYPPRTFELSFRFPTAAEEAAVMALLVDKVRGGAESVVIIPADDLGPAAAVYGDLGAGAQVSHNPALAFQPDDTKREYYSDVRFTVDEGAGFVLESDD